MPRPPVNIAAISAVPPVKAAAANACADIPAAGREVEAHDAFGR